jgi:RNA polymerase sigma factor (sigma-70 family)
MSFKEAEIIEKCKSGDRAAQKMLYERFFAYGMAVALRYCSIKEEAQEVIHDSFMKVYANINKYEDKGNFKNWFRRIIVNAAIDSIRKNKEHAFQVDLEEAERTFSTKSSSLGTDGIEYQELFVLIQTLPTAYRAVFCMYVIDGYSHAEIAKELGINEGTSKSNLSRAREVLRKKLEKIDLAAEKLRIGL